MPCLTLPSMPALGRHPALRPQHGPSVHPRQTSKSIEPLWSFGKPQEEKPMDVTQCIQWKSRIAKYFFPKKHQSTALSDKLYSCIVFLLTEGTARILSDCHNTELSIEGCEASKKSNEDPWILPRKFRAKRTREWSGRCRKYFACLQPDDSCHSLFCLWTAQADRAADGRYTDTNRWLRSNKVRGGGLLSKYIHLLVTCNSTVSGYPYELDTVEGC